MIPRISNHISNACSKIDRKKEKEEKKKKKKKGSRLYSLNWLVFGVSFINWCLFTL